VRSYRQANEVAVLDPGDFTAKILEIIRRQVLQSPGTAPTASQSGDNRSSVRTLRAQEIARLQQLRELTFSMQQGDGYHRDFEIRGRAECVTGQHAQASAVRRNRRI
jgi:hypothetical protein